MSASVKILIGLAAIALAGWLHHGPLGGGERLIAAIEAAARANVAQADVPGVSVDLARDPLSRAATLSGRADSFQREGMGSLPGLNDRVAGTQGVAAVGWAGETPPRAVPLIVEELGWMLAAYLLGLAAGLLVLGRRRRQSYLD